MSKISQFSFLGRKTAFSDFRRRHQNPEGQSLEELQGEDEKKKLVQEESRESMFIGVLFGTLRAASHRRRFAPLREHKNREERERE